MEITKEQIKELSQINSQTAFWCRKNYPEAFERIFEVGKWYKSGLVLLNFERHQESDRSLIGYGFDTEGYWMNANNSGWLREEWEEATEAEVFEALKNEAVKRGFVVGCYTQGLIDERLADKELSKVNGSFSLHEEGKILKVEVSGDFFVKRNIFKEGVWAEVIPIITKSEAEKLLNKKIVD